MHKIASMANLSDKTVKGVTITGICLYAAALLAGIEMHRVLLYVSSINAVAGLLIIIHWVWDKLRPLKRLTETRELIVLFIESVIVVLAIHAISSTSLAKWLTILQYIIFAIHELLLILFLIFMLTFKMKKLF